MKHNPNFHNRKSIRLKEYDYSREGMYFITICTKNRKEILSKIEENKNNVGAGSNARPQQIKNTIIGNEIEKIIKYINNNYNNTEIDEYVIMPDHIHMIIKIKNEYDNVYKNRE